MPSRARLDVPPAMQPVIVHDAGGTRCASCPATPTMRVLRECRHGPRGAERALAARAPDRGVEPEPHDRAGHEHVPGRHRRGPVIDPGPADTKHISVIVGQARCGSGPLGPVDAHRSRPLPGDGLVLGEATGAEVSGFNKRDPDLKVDRAIGDGDTIDGTEFRLEVLHTPGYVRVTSASTWTRSGCCSRATRSSTACTRWSRPRPGATWRSTSRTLERLKKMRLLKIEPGHGDVIEEPRARTPTTTSSTGWPWRADPEDPQAGSGRDREIVATLYPDLAEPLVDVAGKQVHADCSSCAPRARSPDVMKSTWSIA